MEKHDSEKFGPIALDHARKPRNNGPLLDFNGHACITGPCGDTMEVWLAIRNDTVEQASFITDGCGSAHACGSMATCLVQGKSIEDAARLQQEDILKALGGLPEEAEHCALLAANVMEAACEEYHGSFKPGPQGKSLHDKTCGDPHSAATGHKTEESRREFEERQKLQAHLSRIRHKVVVISGKGGVGKSTIAVNLAVALVLAGRRVGLLDVDIHGPSVPTMLGLEGQHVSVSEDELVPVNDRALKVMSLGFLLKSPDDAVIWRGPLKMGVIRQFLTEVRWGDLDYLIIDSPPGTGDEPLSVCQLIENIDGAVIVTTPQKVAAIDVRKAITFCRQLKVPVLGVVENMSGFACPKCGEVTSILRAGGGRQLSQEMGVPFLGSIPIDAKIAEACDAGEAFLRAYAKSSTAEIMRDIITSIIALDDATVHSTTANTPEARI